MNNFHTLDVVDRGSGHNFKRVKIKIVLFSRFRFNIIAVALGNYSQRLVLMGKQLFYLKLLLCQFGGHFPGLPPISL